MKQLETLLNFPYVDGVWIDGDFRNYSENGDDKNNIINFPKILTFNDFTEEELQYNIVNDWTRDEMSKKLKIFYSILSKFNYTFLNNTNCQLGGKLKLIHYDALSYEAHADDTQYEESELLTYTQTCDKAYQNYLDLKDSFSYHGHHSLYLHPLFGRGRFRL